MLLHYRTIQHHSTWESGKIKRERFWRWLQEMALLIIVVVAILMWPD